MDDKKTYNIYNKYNSKKNVLFQFQVNFRLKMVYILEQIIQLLIIIFPIQKEIIYILNLISPSLYGASFNIENIMAAYVVS